MRYGYGLHGERTSGIFGIVYVITLYRDAKPIRGWFRFSLRSARRKGEKEQRKAERKDTK